MMSTYYAESFAHPPTDPMCGLSEYSPTAKAVLKGEQKILGYKTVIIQTENGPFLTVDSKSPDLACETLQMSEYERLPTGEPTGRRFELIATRLLRGEPDPTLYRIPNDYAEVPPSKIFQAVAAMHPRQPPSDSMIRSYQVRDQQYLDNRRRNGLQ
jgi:hypothetical protein